MDQKAGKATISIVRSNQNWGCVSQDIELPQQTVGLMDVRRGHPEENWETIYESTS